MIGRMGFDWALLDLQHGGVTWESLPSLVQALDIGATLSIVRVGWNDPAQIMRALDLGASGVVVPMVSTAADAAVAAQAARYPPEGIRSSGPLRPDTGVRGNRRGSHGLQAFRHLP